MQKKAKKWHHILVLGLICLNCAVILKVGHSLFQNYTDEERLLTIGPNNISEQDPLFTQSIPHSSDSTSISASSDNFMALTYGFSIIVPLNRTCFNALPPLVFNINNGTHIMEHNYQVRIFNQSIETNADLLWFFCNPIDLESQQSVLTTFQYVWENTIPDMAIYIEFKIDIEVPLYTIILYKDLLQPHFIFNVWNIETNKYVRYNGSMEYYRNPPEFFLNISDNIPNRMFLNLVINNRIYVFDIEIINNNSVNFTLVIPNWENIPEGLNQIILYLDDNAGNTSPIQLFNFIKDTETPLSSMEMEDLSWLKIGNRLISEYRNPIYQTYEISDKPIFYFSLSAPDISDVILQVNITNIPIGNESFVNSEESLVVMKSAMFRIRSVNEYVIDEANHVLRLTAERVEPKIWKSEIPDWLWEKLDQKKVQMTVLVEDLAGNQAIITLNVIRNDNASKAAFSQPMIQFYSILFTVVVSFSIFLSIMFIHRASKYQPLEKHLAKIDSDLLDLVIPRVDPIITLRFSQFLEHFNKKVDLDCITPPDFQKLINTSLQCINPAEINVLLSNYKMEPDEQEEFLHEMLSLSPEERAEFIITYMENSSSRSLDETEDSIPSVKDENESDLSD